MKLLQILNSIYIKLLFLLLIFYPKVSYAQPQLPQRSVTVSSTQGISFGKFYDKGSGGDIIVDWQGIRTVTGGIVAPPSSVVRPALFEIKLCQGRNITISYSNSTVLTGDNGGIIQMDIGPTQKGNNGVTFAIENNCNFITILRVGGTLHILPNTPPGNFVGSFDISFEQE
jgi:hypothetical protein